MSLVKRTLFSWFENSHRKASICSPISQYQAWFFLTKFENAFWPVIFHLTPGVIYLFEVNNGNSKGSVNKKGTRTTCDAVLVFLWWSLNRFHPFFWQLHCWLWRSKCRLGKSSIQHLRQRYYAQQELRIKLEDLETSKCCGFVVQRRCQNWCFYINMFGIYFQTYTFRRFWNFTTLNDTTRGFVKWLRKRLWWFMNWNV